MKVTCGTDIIEIERIAKCIEDTKGRFQERVYTKQEQRYCETKKAMKHQHYAARFAAKEACLKAISQQIGIYDLEWKELEVVKDESGRPSMICHKPIENIMSIDVSLSHCKAYATAMVVILWKE